ncbi:MAG: hypothetical protein K8S54_03885 [Spirochaetia bacterium]|nr:hypothetical protein [Spirochaetia bacterium]
MDSLLEKPARWQSIHTLRGQEPVRLSFYAERTGFRLKIESEKNEVGVLFRLCAVLFVHGFSIVEGRIQSPKNYAIEDEFFLQLVDSRSNLDEERATEMMNDFERLLFRGVSVLEYLTENERKIPARERKWKGNVDLTFDEKPMLIVSGSDQPGLMLALSQAFFLMDLDILEAFIHTDRLGVVRNQFLVNPSDRRFANAEFRKRLVEEIATLV